MSLAAVFAFVGLVGFIALYFLMFQLAWFEAIFNDKGAGEFGLILSASVAWLGAGSWAEESRRRYSSGSAFELEVEPTDSD